MKRRTEKKRAARAYRAARVRWKRELGDHRRYRPLPEWLQVAVREVWAREVLPLPYWSTVRIGARAC